MPGFDYRLANAGGDMVAGMMAMPPDVAAMPPFWMLYLAVPDCDKAARSIVKSGGTVHREPADIPGTGRFALFADPQGAGFAVVGPK